MLLLARNCHFILEHPFQTLIIRHRRWEWFCNHICKETWDQSDIVYLGDAPSQIYKFIWVMPLQKAHKLGYVRIPIFGAVQPRFGQSAFGKCTLDILHRRGAFFSVIACGSRVLTWDLFPNQSAYKKPSSKQHARNSIWVLLCLLFQPPTISFLNVA